MITYFVRMIDEVMEMLTEERQKEIQKFINLNQATSVQDLVKHFSCSEATIRRDLTALESKGLITRVHGGAIRKQTLNEEAKISEKLVLNASDKDKIAEYSAQLVSSNDTIFMDAGTTTLKMVPYLPTSVQVVTNSLMIARSLDERMIETIILGGKIKHQTDAIIGTQALEQLATYHFSKAFIGVNALDYRYGMTTPDSHEAAIKKLAMQQSLEVYHLADQSKFNKITFASVSALEEGTIITTNLADETYKQYKDKMILKVVK